MTLDDLRAWRRHRVWRFGKRRTRRISAFLGRQSKVGNPVIFDASVFPWVAGFELEWKKVRDEAEQILRRRDALPSFGEISPDQQKIAPGTGWKTFFFWAFGYQDDDALALCPETAQLLATIPGLQTAFLSIVPPRMHIKPHRGISKGLIRGHLGLIVPGAPGECRMRVGEEMCSWEPGRLLVFDDTNTHEVWNDTDEPRVVLLLDFLRPMRVRGRLVASVFLHAIKLTAYVKEPLRNHARWKKRFYPSG